MTVSNTGRGSERLSHLVWLNEERVLNSLAETLVLAVVQDDKHKVFMLEDYVTRQVSSLAKEL